MNENWEIEIGDYIEDKVVQIEFEESTGKVVSVVQENSLWKK